MLARIAMLSIVALLCGCSGVRFIIDAVPAEDALTETTVIRAAGPSKVALIDVSGLIADRRATRLLGASENMVSRFIESLEKARHDDQVRAVVVRINSPGGTVAASEIMYRELVRFREETGKPVVVSMCDVAASGGYYLACGADEIIAQPSTITGSIGVIIQTVNVSEGLSRIGVHAEAITSGTNKAMGSPLQPMSDEHRQLLQGIVNEFYAAFRGVVVAGRSGLDQSQLDSITDGRIVTGARAAEIGLVDRTGDWRDAFAAAKKRAGLETARLVKYHRPVDYVGSAYSMAPAHAAQTEINLLQIELDGGPLIEQAGFYYLWDPSAW